VRRQEILQQSENNLLVQTQQVEQQRLALESERNALQHHRGQLDTDRQVLAGEKAALAGERQHLETLRNQDRTNEDELSRRLAEQARLLTEATERLNRLTQELQQQQALLEAARQELDDERAQWDAERQRLLHDYEQQLAELRLELNRHGTAPPESAPDYDRAAESEEEVFARLRSMSLLKMEVAEDQAGETLDGLEATSVTHEADQADEGQRWVRNEHSRPNEWSDAPVEPRKGALPPGAERNAEDEKSIDDYMAQLLKRVRGVGSAHQGPASQAPERPTRVAQNVPESSSAPPSSEQIPAVQEVPAKLARRAPAPELSSDLAAMRELANLSARAAIDKHAYRNWGRAAFGKFTIALLAAGTGAGAVSFAPAPDSMLMYAGLSSFVVALFWLLQAGILMNHVIKASRRNDQFINTSDIEDNDDVSAESSDESAPAELIHAHDAYQVPHDEAVTDQAYEVAATDDDDREPLETAVSSTDSGDPTTDEPDDKKAGVTLE